MNYSELFRYMRENNIPLDHAFEVALNMLAAHDLAGIYFDELKRVEEADKARLIAKGIGEAVAA